MSTISAIDNTKTAKPLSDHNNTCYKGALDENEEQVVFAPFEAIFSSKAHAAKENFNSWLDNGLSTRSMLKIEKIVHQMKKFLIFVQPNFNHTRIKQILIGANLRSNKCLTLLSHNTFKEVFCNILYMN